MKFIFLDVDDGLNETKEYEADIDIDKELYNRGKGQCPSGVFVAMAE